MNSYVQRIRTAPFAHRGSFPSGKILALLLLTCVSLTRCTGCGGSGQFASQSLGLPVGESVLSAAPVVGAGIGVGGPYKTHHRICGLMRNVRQTSENGRYERLPRRAP